ncbi:hypothetical protein HPB51_023912 [Rhipicephalus microplus]|uniref:Uncharacterized protein n=1 Tax=Rhipicephalus microplus TaxID=6941 RepID=A0A9J6DY57_RHIMP|nr:hypothetical protein HPB51_023912 [Rhipicephalus microplus]
MQRPAQHSTPTTTDALSVSPASSGRTTDTAPPPLSTSGYITSPAPTAIQQHAAFLNSAYGPAMRNAGSVSATSSMITMQTPKPESSNAALALKSTTPAAVPTMSAPGIPIGNFECVDKRVSTSIVPPIAEVFPSITSADDSWTERTSRRYRSTKTIRDPLKAAGTPSVPIENLPRPPAVLLAHHRRNPTSTWKTNAETASVRPACYHNWLPQIFLP